jgi:hypothetical protein
MKFSISPYLKAIYGSIATGLGALAVAYSDNVITNQEWVTIGIATFGALGVIWAVPNAHKSPPTNNQPGPGP